MIDFRVATTDRAPTAMTDFKAEITEISRGTAGFSQEMIRETTNFNRADGLRRKAK
jgi:hypothetical protein